MAIAPAFCSAEEPDADQAKALSEMKKVARKIAFDDKIPDKPVILIWSDRLREVGAEK